MYQVRSRDMGSLFGDGVVPVTRLRAGTTTRPPLSITRSALSKRGMTRFAASPISLRSIRLAGGLSASPIRPLATTYIIIYCTLCLVKAGMTRKFPFWGSLNRCFGFSENEVFNSPG